MHLIVNLRKYRDLLICLFLTSAVLVAYWQLQNCELIDYDDVTYITKNRYVKAGLTWDGLLWAMRDTHTGYWHPLTWLSHMLDYQVFKLNAGGHHWTSLIFHIANTCLLYLVFKRITGEAWESAFIAALFAIHPLNVESVAWVAERKSVLSTFFMLTAMWLYVSYVKYPGVFRYFLVLLGFALGLMAKPMLVTFPFVLLLLDYWPLGRLMSWKDLGRLIFEKTPFFVLTIVLSVVTYLGNRYEGAVVSFDALPIEDRINNAIFSYVKYIGKMFWPEDLAIFYPYSIPYAVFRIMGAALMLTGITITVIFLARRYRYAIVGWFWYLGTLVPVIGLIQSGEQAMADRYTYIPLIGLFIMVSWGFSDLLKSFRYQKIFSIVSSGLVMTILTSSTWFQAQHWQNSLTLFNHTLRVTHGNYLAHNNLGVALLRKGKTEEAKFQFAQAIKIKRDYPEALNNMGLALAVQGRVDEAISFYSEVLRIRKNDEKAYNNMGIALAERRRSDEAVECFKKALEINPDYDDALNNMGSALARRGDARGSIYYFEKALQLDANNAMAHNNLGMALARVGRNDAAVLHFREALKIRPDYLEAYKSLQVTLSYIKSAKRSTR